MHTAERHAYDAGERAPGEQLPDPWDTDADDEFDAFGQPVRTGYNWRQAWT